MVIKKPIKSLGEMIGMDLVDDAVGEIVKHRRWCLLESFGLVASQADLRLRDLAILDALTTLLDCVFSEFDGPEYFWRVIIREENHFLFAGNHCLVDDNVGELRDFVTLFVAGFVWLLIE